MIIYFIVCVGSPIIVYKNLQKIEANTLLRRLDISNNTVGAHWFVNPSYEEGFGYDLNFDESEYDLKRFPFKHTFKRDRDEEPDQCELQSVGIITLQAAIAANTSLTELNLGQNIIPGEHMLRLIELWQRKENLQTFCGFPRTAASSSNAAGKMLGPECLNRGPHIVGTCVH